MFLPWHYVALKLLVLFVAYHYYTPSSLTRLLFHSKISFSAKFCGRSLKFSHLACRQHFVSILSAYGPAHSGGIHTRWWCLYQESPFYISKTPTHAVLSALPGGKWHNNIIATRLARNYSQVWIRKWYRIVKFSFNKNLDWKLTNNWTRSKSTNRAKTVEIDS